MSLRYSGEPNSIKTWEDDLGKGWENWLGDYYSKYLSRIRERVTAICISDRKRNGHLPFYTPHGEAHFQSVEDMIHHLIPDNNWQSFTERERFYLLASAWLHDLGMMESIVEELYGNIKFMPNEIRKRHHITSEIYIVKFSEKLGLDEVDSRPLSKICRFHRKQERIEDCEDELIVGGDKVRLKLLSAYLRIADAFDIGISRVPSEDYAICLTYDIPIDLKLHWIKSKLVNGIWPNQIERKITVSFAVPDFSGDPELPDEGRIKKKLDRIINLVLEDLQSELKSVKHIIAKYGPCTYLDVDKNETAFKLTGQNMSDLREVVINYDIMMDPSASKLLEMMMVSIADILGYSLYKSGRPEKITSAGPDAKIVKKLSDFLEFLEGGIIKTRSCHLGVHKLVKRFREMINNRSKINELVEEVGRLYREHHLIRSKIRENARRFLESEFPGLKDNGELNILLYGYSELVAKAICGFRDAFLSPSGQYTPEDLYNSRKEEEVSRKINLFICEGQPKTQTAGGENLVYHDGALYASYFKRRKFTNIIMIPDAIAGHLIENLPIHFLIVGANGVSKRSFKHSAGHSTIVSLVREYCNRVPEGKPKPQVVLVVSGEKYMPEKVDAVKSPYCETVSSAVSEALANPSIVDRCRFLDNLGSEVRESVWMVKDRELLERLYQAGIMFYNPREDNIPISRIDFLISESRYSKISEGDMGVSIAEHFRPHKEDVIMEEA